MPQCHILVQASTPRVRLFVSRTTILQQYIEHGLDSNRNIVDTDPTALDVISKLVEKGILSSNQDMDDIFNAIQMIENEYYYYRPRFYSPGSSQHESVMKVVAQFDTIASTTTTTAA